MGIVATALALGGVLGPSSSGLLVEHLGFRWAFLAFALVASLAVAVVVLLMPETRPIRTPRDRARVPA